MVSALILISTWELSIFCTICWQGMRRIGTSRGQLSNQSDVSRSPSQPEMRNSAASPAHGPGDRSPHREPQGQPVETVHVTKCTVCVILWTVNYHVSRCSRWRGGPKCPARVLLQRRPQMVQMTTCVVFAVCVQTNNDQSVACMVSLKQRIFLTEENAVELFCYWETDKRSRAVTVYGSQ